MNDPDLAQVIAGAGLALAVAALYVIKRDDYVATADITVPPRDAPQIAAPEPEGGSEGPAAVETGVTTRMFRRGTVVPKQIGEPVVGIQTRKQRRSWLAALVVGKAIARPPPIQWHFYGRSPSSGACCRS